MTFFLQSALALGLPPAVVTFIGLVLAWGAAKRERRFVSRCLTGFAVAFGYAVGHRIATGALPFMPSSAEHWLPLLALMAALLGILESLPNIPRFWRWLWRLLFGIVAVTVLLLPLPSLSPTGKAIGSVGLGVLMAAVWTGLNGLAGRVTDASLPIALAITAAINSVALLIAHTAIVSQLSGVLAATMGAAFVFVLWQRRWSLLGGAMGVVTVLLFGAGINGIFYADLPIPSALFLWLAPLTGWLRLYRSVQSWHPIASIALQLIATTLFAAIGLGIAIRQLGLPTGGY